MRHHLCRQGVALAGTRQLRSQGSVSVHAHSTVGVTESEGREGTNGVGGGIGVGSGIRDGNGVRLENVDDVKIAMGTGTQRELERGGGGRRNATWKRGRERGRGGDGNGNEWETRGRTQGRNGDGSGDGNKIRSVD